MFETTMVSSFRILQVFLVSGAFICQTEAICADKVKNCHRVSGRCQDARVGTTVRRNCQATCGVCKAETGACADNPNCLHWNRNGFCSSRMMSNEVKQRMCPRTCGFGCPRSGSAVGSGSEKKYQFFLDNLDESIDPCSDFYRFTCGKYISRHPPKEPSSDFSTFSDLNNEVTRKHVDLLLNNDATDSSAVKKMRQYRDMCMDIAKINQARTGDLRADLTTMGKCPMLDATWTPPGTFDRTKLLIDMIKLTGTNFLFNLRAFLDPETKSTVAVFYPTKTILTRLSTYKDPKNQDKIQAVHDFLSQIIGIIGSDAKSDRKLSDIERAIDKVLEMDKKIAEILIKYDYKGDIEDITKMDKKKYADLGTITAAVDWNRLISSDNRMPQDVKNYFTTKNPDIRIYNDMLKELSTYYVAAPVEDLTNYLCVKFIMTQMPYLDSRFIQAANRLAEKLDNSPHKSTRVQDCYDTITSAFPLVSDYLYVKKYLPESTVKAVSQMIEELRSGLSDVFMENAWMSSTTRTNAQNKIKKTKKIIGVVEDAKDASKLDKRYAGLEFSAGDTFRKAALKINENTIKQEMMKLVDTTLLSTSSEDMRSTDINAMHIYEENLIYMAAAMLQPPFFVPELPSAINYGGIGFVVGHEFTHGFDTGGSDYDESGQKKSWWDSKTRSEFDSRSKCFVDLYGRQVEPHIKQNVDGKLTIPENIADNGGIKAAFLAYKKHMKGQKERSVPGYQKYTNEQAFFIAYGTIFCTSMSNELLESRIKRDPHSPAEFRINVVVSNYDEFAKAFKCKKGSMMNPAQQCKVW